MASELLHGGLGVTDLFRFMLVRAPQQIPHEDVDVLAGPRGADAIIELDLQTVDIARSLPQELVAAGGPAGKIRSSLPARPTKEVRSAIKADHAAVGQALLRLKLDQEPTPGYPAAELIELRRRYDLLTRALAARSVRKRIRPRPVAVS